jgi:hypothetical protein
MNPLPVLIYHYDQARRMFDIPPFPGGPGYSYIILVPTGTYEEEENPYERLNIVKATPLLSLLGIRVGNPHLLKIESDDPKQPEYFGLVQHQGNGYRLFMV